MKISGKTILILCAAPFAAAGFANAGSFSSVSPSFTTQSSNFQHKSFDSASERFNPKDFSGADSFTLPENRLSQTPQNNNFSTANSNSRFNNVNSQFQSVAGNADAQFSGQVETNFSHMRMEFHDPGLTHLNFNVK